MHPAQVLDLQADFIARTSLPGWREMVRIHLLQDFKDSSNWQSTQTMYEVAEEMSYRLGPAVGRAHAYYVDPNMTDMIMWASAGLDGTDQFRFNEVPTEEGFIYFPRPIKLLDVRNTTMLVHAVVWLPIIYQTETERRMGYAFFSFNDYNNELDEVAKAMQEGGIDISEYGRWGLVSLVSATDGQRVGPDTIGITEEKRKEIIDEGAVPSEFTNLVKIIHAYFLLLNQTIVDSYEAEVSRAASKRAKRMGIPDRVTVIRLRRVVNADAYGNETDVEWQHQWLVRGHWRWQHVSENHPLAKEDGRGGYVARVWVRPHIKGPEDKPLHVTDKVIALMR